MADTYTYGDFQYYRRFFSWEADWVYDYVTISAYTGVGGDVEIPSYVSGVDRITGEPFTLPVMSIVDTYNSIQGMGVFENKNITSIYIPDGIYQVPDNCFANNQISFLSFDRDIRLEANCFSRNPLTEGVILNADITASSLSPYSSPFAGCDIGNRLTITSNVTTVGYALFRDCGLTSVSIPTSVTNIDLWAFASNEIDYLEINHSLTLKATCFNDNNFINGIVLNADIIYDSWGGLPNTGYYNRGAFENATIGDGLVITSNVSNIPQYLFSKCGLTSVEIPSSISEIHDYAFYNNRSLMSFTNFNSTTVYGSNVLLACMSSSYKGTIHGYYDTTTSDWWSDNYTQTYNFLDPFTVSKGNPMFYKTVVESQNGGTWSKWTPISKVVGYGQSDAHIAVDKDGVIHVVCGGRDSIYNRDQVKYSKSTDLGVTWSNWVVIAPTPSKTQYDSKIAVDQNGVIHVVWSRYSTTAYDVVHSKSTDGGIIWSNPSTIGAILNKSQYEPTLVIDSNNNLHVCWDGGDSLNTESQIKYSKSTNEGSTWSEWINVSPTALYEQMHPFIMSDSNDNLHIFWSNNRVTGDYQITHSKSTDGGITWSIGSYITPIEGDYQYRPTVAINNNGDICVVAESSGGASFAYGSIFSKSVDGGDNWSSPIYLGTELVEPYIVISPNDTIHMLAGGYIGDYSEIFHIQSIDGGITWSDQQAIASSIKDDYSPFCAVYNNYVLAVCYGWGDDTWAQIKFSKLEGSALSYNWTRVRRLKYKNGTSWQG